MDAIKLLFPADRTAFQYGNPGDPIRTPQVTAIIVYIDEAATILADIYNSTDAGRIANSTIYTDVTGLLPEFFGPVGITRLWAVPQVNGEPTRPYPLDAAFGPRIDELTMTITGNVNTIRSGHGVPPTILGEMGDWYIDKDTLTIYGPKADVWGSGMSLLGQPGQPGPAGPPGPSAGNPAFQYQQYAAASLWDIVHPLSFPPNVMIVDSAGTRVEGDVRVLTPSHIQVEFSVPFSGTALLS